MPASYAHNRFGEAVFLRMPADVCGPVRRNRRLFDVGLQGPDLFFFYKPLMPTKVGRLGHKFHMQTGREFFSRVCRSLRLEPSEEGQAYLYGVLCHYALDSETHPLVEQYSWDGIASHSRIEAEFERFLRQRDGATELPLAKRFRLTDRECRTAARFYPGTEVRHIRESLQGMGRILEIMELPEGPVRSAVVKTMGAASATFRDMVVRREPDPSCQMLNEPLLEHFQQALQRFPELLMQLTAHLTYNAPLGAEFDRIFG